MPLFEEVLNVIWRTQFTPDKSCLNMDGSKDKRWVQIFSLSCSGRPVNKCIIEGAKVYRLLVIGNR